MKRNNDKISSKYRIRWFGSVTEVKPGTATSEISVGSVRFNPLVRFGSVRLPFLPPTEMLAIKNPSFATLASGSYL